MLKIRTILFVILLTFSANSVTHAANPFLVATNDEGLIVSTGFFDKVESTLDRLDEIDVNLVNNLAEKLEVKPETYTVVEGDNLYRIALEHDISLESLISWNNLSGDLIYPEDELIVSGNDEEIEVADSEQSKIEPVITQAITPPADEDATEMYVTATAYTAYCKGCSGTTAYGIDLRSNPDVKVIAVDPRIIPLGSKVWVEGYGEAIAGDTGGAIKGKKIDVFIPSHENAMEWGVKKVKIKVID